LFESYFKTDDKISGIKFFEARNQFIEHIQENPKEIKAALKKFFIIKDLSRGQKTILEETIKDILNDYESRAYRMMIEKVKSETTAFDVIEDIFNETKYDIETFKKRIEREYLLKGFVNELFYKSSTFEIEKFIIFFENKKELTENEISNLKVLYHMKSLCTKTTNLNDLNELQHEFAKFKAEDREDKFITELRKGLDKGFSL